MTEKIYLFIGFALFSFQIFAQVPVIGREQHFGFSTQEVNRLASAKYSETTATLKLSASLDDDPIILARVEMVFASLVRAAAYLKPASATWRWEVHTSSDSQIDAYCMAGGKLIIGSFFVRRLHLSNGELATLIGHEVGHVIAEHHREILSNVLHLNPLPATSLQIVSDQLDSDTRLPFRLAALSNLQESEADQLGILLAHRAGWASSSMIHFYQKLMLDERPTFLSMNYPPSSSRLAMAYRMTLSFKR
jgi:predicted Zn-dependent protease